MVVKEIHSAIMRNGPPAEIVSRADSNGVAHHKVTLDVEAANGKIFSGTGSNQRDAKHVAYEHFLQYIEDECYDGSIVLKLTQDIVLFGAEAHARWGAKSR